MTSCFQQVVNMSSFGLWKFCLVARNKNKQLIENVQRWATRLIPDLRDLSYEERLYNLNLPTLEYCRKPGDLIQLLKMIHGIDDIDVTKFMSFSTNTTRRHMHKLNKPRCKKNHQ